MHDFKLLDIHRHTHPHDRFYTWFNGTVACGLDRFYISLSCVPSCLRGNVIAVPFSDHSLITLHLKLPSTPTSMWANTPVHDSNWWHWVKVHIKELVIEHSKLLTARRRNEI